MVTSAIGPTRDSTRFSAKNGVAHTLLPDDRAAHSHADAERGEPVAAVALAQCVRELRDQPHAGRGERVAARDRAAVRVEARVVRRDPELVAPRQHLHGERLVQLEDVDLVERQSGLLQRAPRRGHRAVAHQVRLDTGVRKRDEAELRLDAELRGDRLRREERRRRAVRQPGGVSGGDAAAGAERRLQRGEPVERRVGPEELVAVGDLPAVVGEDGHRHDGLAHDAVLPRSGGLLLRRERERVGALLRDRGEAVVEILRGLAHRRGGLVDQPLGDEAWVEVDVLAHRVVAHVLDAARDRDVDRAERDLAGSRGDGGERACAHPVDGEAGHGLRQPGEQRDVAAEGQTLVADLRRRREHDVADPVDGDLGIASQQLADGLHAHVVGARAPELSFRPGAPERGTDAVDENDLAELPWHRLDDTPWWWTGRSEPTQRSSATAAVRRGISTSASSRSSGTRPGRRGSACSRRDGATTRRSGSAARLSATARAGKPRRPARGAARSAR